MKKSLPYILGGIIIVAAAVLIITGNNRKHRELDERLSFLKRDKIPYGAYVAYQGLSREHILLPMTKHPFTGIHFLNMNLARH